MPSGTIKPILNGTIKTDSYGKSGQCWDPEKGTGLVSNK